MSKSAFLGGVILLIAGAVAIEMLRPAEFYEGKIITFENGDTFKLIEQWPYGAWVVEVTSDDTSGIPFEILVPEQDLQDAVAEGRFPPQSATLVPLTHSSAAVAIEPVEAPR